MAAIVESHRDVSDVLCILLCDRFCSAAVVDAAAAYAAANAYARTCPHMPFLRMHVWRCVFVYFGLNSARDARGNCEIVFHTICTVCEVCEVSEVTSLTCVALVREVSEVRPRWCLHSGAHGPNELLPSLHGQLVVLFVLPRIALAWDVQK